MEFPALTKNLKNPSSKVVDDFMKRILSRKADFELNFSPRREIGAMAIPAGDFLSAWTIEYFLSQTSSGSVYYSGNQLMNYDAGTAATGSGDALYPHESRKKVMYYTGASPSTDLDVINFDNTATGFRLVGSAISLTLTYKTEDDAIQSDGDGTWSIFAFTAGNWSSVSWKLVADTGDILDLSLINYSDNVKGLIIPVMDYSSFNLTMSQDATASGGFWVEFEIASIDVMSKETTIYVDRDGNDISPSEEISNVINRTDFSTVKAMISEDMRSVLRTIGAWDASFSGTNDPTIVNSVKKWYAARS